MTSFSFTLRDASKADTVRLADLITQLGYPTDPRQMTERLSTMLNDGTAATIIAEMDGDAVGMISAKLDASYEFDGVQGRIVALVVDEDWRGRGVGKALVQAAELWSRSRGAMKMMVNTATHRAGAHEFYRDLDYEQTGIRFVKPL